MPSMALTPKEIIFADLERELAVTRKVLEHLPEEHYDFKPHAKSMSMRELAMHVANLPDWGTSCIAKKELDAATMRPQARSASNRQHLLESFDRHAAELKEAVAGFDTSAYSEDWTMRRGGKVMTTQPRWKVYRVWSINHMIHHRAQLCLYLRLLNVPVPTVYFNTADDPTWVFE